MPGVNAKSLNWRVRLLAIEGNRIVVEHPVTLRRRVPIAVGGTIVGSLSIGQNRWMFTTAVLAVTVREIGGRPRAVVELLMPDDVERCQRRSFYRISTASLSLPAVRCTSIADATDAVPLEVATRAAILNAAGTNSVQDVQSLEARLLSGGPASEGVLLNIGGGGAGLRMPPSCGPMLDRPSYFLLQVDLTPDVPLPLPITAKLAHTRIDSSQNIQAGFSFDFSLHQEYESFISETICRYIAGLQIGDRLAA